MKKSIAVSDILPGDSFNVGELRMVQFYRRGYLSSMWTPIDTFTDFCATTIQLAIENLVLHKICSCETGFIENKILFFNLSDTADFLTCDTTFAGNKPLGYLESRIMKDILQRPSHSVADYVRALLQPILPKQTYINPGKEIICHILMENSSSYWRYNCEKILFWKKIDFHIGQSREDEMVTALNNVSLPVLEERNHNKGFREFSDRLYTLVYAALREKLNDSN